MRKPVLAVAFVVASFGLPGCVADHPQDTAETADKFTARVGPSSKPQVVTILNDQKGALWQLLNGKILTSFHTKSEWNTGGTRHSFALRTIDGTSVVKTPDTSSGGCQERFNGFYGCKVGPGSATGTDIMGWYGRHEFSTVYYEDAEVEDRSVMLADGLYIAQTSYVPGTPARGAAIVRIDPATGAQSNVGPLLESFVGLSPAPRETYYRLRELPGQKLAFSTRLLSDGATQPVPQTRVVTANGTVVGQHDGWLVESQEGTPNVLLWLNAGPVWWNTATNATTPAPNLDWALLNVARVARNGDIIAEGESEIAYFSRDGSIAQRNTIPSRTAVDVMAVLPGGGYISKEYTTAGEVIRLTDPRRTPSVVQLSTEASILAETGWTLGENSFRLPTYEGAGAVVADDAGNSYVSYHLRRNDGIYESYVISFDKNGARRWGTLASNTGAMCIPWTALSDSRLALRCATAYSGRLILMGN